MTKYTFLLPAYKAAFFKEALQSIKGQTYTDFKVLVSDDCSPEPLKPVFDEVCGSDPRFTYRRNETNMGSKSLVSHWNLLVDMCDTDFLVMASDDDVYHPRFLEEIDRLQCKYPEVDLLRARVKAVDENGEMIDKDAIYEEYVDNLDFFRQKHFNNSLRCIANYVFRTSVLKAKDGFVDFPLAIYSDDATVLIMAENGAVNTKNMAFNFRLSNSSVSGRELTPSDCFQKALATLLYDKWFYAYLRKRKHIWGASVYVGKSCALIEREHKQYRDDLFISVALGCRFLDYIKLLSYVKVTKKRIKFMYAYLYHKLFLE